MTDERFDEILYEMRDESVSPEQSAAARDRVWQKIAALPMIACAGFREEFGAYVSGRLSESRRLLVDDHLSRCTDCRRVLAELRDGSKSKVTPMPVRRSKMPAWTKWAVAAGIAGIAIYAGRDVIDRAMAPGGARATVVSVAGELYTLPQNSLTPGATLADGDVVRTTAGSRAILQLADGSRVEMNQRTELFIRAAWSGETIWLDRGDVIVEAAKQRRGSLRVVTRDSIASVKGTVFGVSSGSAGSLVAVVEGSVAVQQGGLNQTLKPGQTAVSNEALRPVQVHDSVAWSKEAAKYSAILAEVSNIEKQVANAIPPPRTQADLLRFLPAGVEVYIAIPNLDGAIRQALYQFDQRARSNSLLGEWWNSEHGQQVRQTMDRLQAVTPLLGDEVVYVISNVAGKDQSLLLSRIQNGRESALRAAMDRLTIEDGEKIPYKINQDLLMVGGGDLSSAAARLGTGASSPFAAEIARRYQNGVGLLAAIDVGAIGPDNKRTETRMIGLSNMRYLFLEQRSGTQGEANDATLSFNGARTGLASWLAPAGSVGSAEYVSPDAVVVFSASTKDPRQAFDELIGLIHGDLSELRRFESETGVNLQTDLAGTLGTDFTVAVERPTIPIPGWVVAYEVVRPGVLDDTIRRLTDAFNRHSAQKVVFAQESLNGRTWNSLKSEAAAGLTLHWTYDRGYLVASTDRALAANAIAIRDSGASLMRSASFQSHFPSSSGLHHSGFIWVNTTGAIADAAAVLPIENPAIKSLLGSREPLLIVLDGEMERIHASSRNRLTSMLLDLVAVHAVPGQEGQGPVVRDKMKPALKARE